jgi:hypothetical protein
VDDPCDLVVEALDLARGDAVFEECCDCRQVAKQAACEAAQRPYPRLLDQRAPTPDAHRSRAGTGYDRVYVPELFLEDAVTGDFRIEPGDSAYRANRELSIFSHPATSRKHEPLITFFPSAFAARHSLRRTSPQGGVEVGDDVETVMDNLRTGQIPAQDGAVSSVAINANGANLGFLRIGEKGEKRFEALLLLALGHVPQLAGKAVEDDRHVAVAFADGLLIDKQDLKIV